MFLIKNANLVSMADIDEEIVDILTDGKIITKIGKIDEKDYPEAEVFDAMGRLVTPGIVEGHCHIGVSEQAIRSEGDDCNEFSSPIVPHMRAIDGIKPQDMAYAQAINAGVTTVVTGPGSGEVISGTFCAMKTYGRTVLDMVFRDDVAMKFAFGENPKRFFGTKGLMPMTRMGTAALMRENLQKAKIYHDKKKAFENGEKDAKEPEYNAAIARLSLVFDGMRVKMHAHQQDDIVTAIRMMEEFGLEGTIEHCSEGYLIPEVLKEKNQKITIGPTMVSLSKYEVRNKTFDAGKVYYDNGIEFSIMTDHPVISIEYLTTQAAHYIKHGVPAKEVLKAITINPAKFNGIDDVVGSIEVGKDADIVVWSGDLFHYMTQAEAVFINGEKVKG